MFASSSSATHAFVSQQISTKDRWLGKDRVTGCDSVQTNLAGPLESNLSPRVGAYLYRTLLNCCFSGLLGIHTHEQLHLHVSI